MAGSTLNFLWGYCLSLTDFNFHLIQLSDWSIGQPFLLLIKKKKKAQPFYWPLFQYQYWKKRPLNQRNRALIKNVFKLP